MQVSQEKAVLPQERLAHLVEKKAVLERHVDQFFGAAVGGMLASSVGGLLFRRPVEGLVGFLISGAVAHTGLYFESRAMEIDREIKRLK